MTNPPFAPSQEEIQELTESTELQGLFGANSSKEMAEFLESAWIAKFEFINGSPGYVGDLFLIQPETLDFDIPVIRLYRDRNRKLVVLDDKRF